MTPPPASVPHCLCQWSFSTVTTRPGGFGTFLNLTLVWVIMNGLMLAAGLLLLATIPQQSFPKIERNQFAVEIFLPPGSSLRQTDAVMKELEEKLGQKLPVYFMISKADLLAGFMEFFDDLDKTAREQVWGDE